MAKPKSKPRKRKVHLVRYVALGGPFSDSFACSCGWKSEGYWDYEEAAWNEWLLHAHDVKSRGGQVFIEPRDEERQKRLVADRAARRVNLKTRRESIDRQLKQLSPRSRK